MKTISVRAAKPYKVIIEGGALSHCGEYIRQETRAHIAALFTDDRVNPLYGDAAEKSLVSAGFEVCRFVFKNGESSKNIEVLSEMLEFLAENKLSADDAVVALGGGVCGDMAGFAASCYMRGTNVFQIPTTFLAAIDSSVGGKTAINLRAGKNLAGAFHQPCGVICDTQLFRTLDEDIFRDGTAEAIKYGVILDKNLFNLIKNEDIHQHIDEVVARCVSLKADIVEMDEYDRGTRHLLNFGHTVGHAIEKCSGFKISHGKAVAAGMVIESNTANVAVSEEIASVNKKYSLPCDCTFSASQLAEAARLDKKRSGDTLSVIVAGEIGKCTLDTICIDSLEKYIEKGMGKKI